MRIPTRTKVIITACTALTLIGVFSAGPAGAQNTAKVTGTISYRDRSALPDNAEITVQLIDSSRQDVAATVIAEQKFTSNGNQSPFPFDLIYNPTVIDSKLNYAVQATITIDGKVMYRNSEAYLVITPTKPAANLDNVTVTVRRIQSDGTQPTASAPINLPVEPTTSTSPRTLPATGDTNSLPIKLLFAALALLAGSAGIRFWLKQRV